MSLFQGLGSRLGAGALLAVTLLAILATAAPGQPYPTRPLKLLLSFPPGGASVRCLIAPSHHRTIASSVRALMGSQMIKW